MIARQFAINSRRLDLFPDFSSFRDTRRESSPPDAAGAGRDAANSSTIEWNQTRGGRALRDDERARRYNGFECEDRRRCVALCQPHSDSRCGRVECRSGRNPMRALEVSANRSPRNRDCRTRAIRFAMEFRLHDRAQRIGHSIPDREEGERRAAMLRFLISLSA